MMDFLPRREPVGTAHLGTDGKLHSAPDCPRLTGEPREVAIYDLFGSTTVAHFKAGEDADGRPLRDWRQVCLSCCLAAGEAFRRHCAGYEVDPRRVALIYAAMQDDAERSFRDGPETPCDSFECAAAALAGEPERDFGTFGVYDLRGVIVGTASLTEGSVRFTVRRDTDVGRLLRDAAERKGPFPLRWTERGLEIGPVEPLVAGEPPMSSPWKPAPAPMAPVWVRIRDGNGEWRPLPEPVRFLDAVQFRTFAGQTVTVAPDGYEWAPCNPPADEPETFETVCWTCGGTDDARCATVRPEPAVVREAPLCAICRKRQGATLCNPPGEGEAAPAAPGPGPSADTRERVAEFRREMQARGRRLKTPCTFRSLGAYPELGGAEVVEVPADSEAYMLTASPATGLPTVIVLRETADGAEARYCHNVTGPLLPFADEPAPVSADLPEGE